MAKRVGISPGLETANAESASQRAPQAERARRGVDRLLRLQQAIGNRATQSLLARGLLQPKLRIGPVDDVYEREADRTAQRIMRMPDPHLDQARPLESPNGQVQRMCSECEEEEKEVGSVQRKPRSSGASPVKSGVESRISSLRGGGQPLPPAARSFFEPRFNHNFGDVRIHTGPSAAEAAQPINARAFTIGRDIVFNAGEYAPHSNNGRWLLAHELTHVGQQGAAQPLGNRAGSHSATRLSSLVVHQKSGGQTRIQRKPVIPESVLRTVDVHRKRVHLARLKKELRECERDTSCWDQREYRRAIRILERHLSPKLRVKGCDRKETPTVKQVVYAENRAISMLDQVLPLLSTKPIAPKVAAEFKDTFGSSSKKTVSKVRRVFRTILAKLLLKDFNYECDLMTDTFTECGSADEAYVIRLVGQVVHICPLLKSNSTKSSASTIIHELTHKYFNTSDHVPTPGVSTEDALDSAMHYEKILAALLKSKGRP